MFRDGSRGNNNQTGTWTGQGIARYSEGKGREIDSVFRRFSLQQEIFFFLSNTAIRVFEYELDENGASRVEDMGMEMTRQKRG